MSSKITIKPNPGVGTIGLIAILTGLIMIIVGGSAWGMVASQLAAENITVSADSKFMANKNVNDPLSAFAQAAVIEQHALEMTGGKTYAQLDADDPMRETVMNASFLRASLFTSVVAFGVSLFVIAVGLVVIVIGWSLRRLAGGPPVVVETSADGPVNVVGLGGKPVLRKPTVLDPGLPESGPDYVPPTGAPQAAAPIVAPEPVTEPQAPADEQAMPGVNSGPVRIPVVSAIALAEPAGAVPTPFPGMAAKIDAESQQNTQPVAADPSSAEQGEPEPEPAPSTPVVVEQPPAPSRTAERAPGTGTIPIVSAVQPDSADLSKPAVSGSDAHDGGEAPVLAAKSGTGAKGWSSPADRLPKDPKPKQ